MRPTRPQQPETTPDGFSEVDLPLPVEGLCDLVLTRTADGGLARPDAPGAALTAEELADHAHAAGVSGRDLRVLVDDGARNAALLGRVADALGCDILVTPAGATVERLAGPGGGTRAEAVPVDRASGEVVDWLLIQPAGLATTLPGWFDLAGGLVLHRAGLVTLPLPGGLEFANRDDFVLRRAAASRLGLGHPDLVTVALATRGGGFRLTTYRVDRTGDQRGRVSGRDVAAALSSIYLYGGDLRLWLRWPDDTGECTRLETEVAALAESTGATVWAPEPGGQAVLLRGSRDLAARGRDGTVVGWRAYRPPHTPEQDRFETDLDGRLVPRGGPKVTAVGGVSLLNVGRASEDELLDRYGELSAEPGMMLIDLTVLDDGRLALRYGDGTHLAAGTAGLRSLLEGSGWKSEDLQLLTPVTPERADGLREHLTVLEAELGVEIWSLSPGAEVVVRDGLARAVDEQRKPARWLRAADPATVDTGRWRNDDGWLIPRRRHTPRPLPAPPPPAEPAAAAPPPDRVLPPPSPRPALTVPGRATRAHGVRWLPDQPEVNAEPVRLWLASAWSPQRVSIEGVPSPNLFLIAHLDGERVAGAAPQKHLLCLRVEAGGAVDLGRVGTVPADLKHLATEGGTYLLPAGWLDQARLQVAYTIGDDGRPGEEVEVAANPIVLRSTGARHGTEGLPNDVATWPRTERGGGAWALIPESPAVPEGDFLPLHTKRPPIHEGQRLVHLQVPAGRAIDVTASAAALVTLTSVRSRLPELVADGVTLLLPRRSYERTPVDQVLFVEAGKWKHRAKGIDLPLSSLIAPERA
ncbi:hypothetical protein [Catenuloplanes atrovinosus]|uniref:Uncharacterized protein n=1 Tax=Catenuloplanes atrovinosus TaxID=137266 RepID=A0AAE3YHX7_9ACTN|nr:hypothetical protein [Catenuloplanes atrovinosus]MDR7274253.1 hypothetical protein [Catenuloplanes atrovinosus]